MKSVEFDTHLETTGNLQDLEGAEFYPMVTSSGELASPEIVELNPMTLVGRIAQMKRTGELDSQPPDTRIAQEILDYAREATGPAYWFDGV